MLIAAGQYCDGLCRKSLWPAELSGKNPTDGCMAYLIITLNGQELERRELSGPVVIGRSAESQLVVRDALISRQHCRIEPYRAGWRVVDLGSRNGTLMGLDRINERKLAEGDLLRVGRSEIRFLTGSFVPGIAAEGNRMARPADPFEALAGTLAGFVVDEDPARVEAEDSEEWSVEAVLGELEVAREKVTQTMLANRRRSAAGYSVRQVGAGDGGMTAVMPRAMTPARADFSLQADEQDIPIQKIVTVARPPAHYLLVTILIAIVSATVAALIVSLIFLARGQV